MSRGDGGATSVDQDAERVRTVARWLDQRFVDPVMGLVAPGLGDILGACFGLYVVALAARRRLPPIVIARMLLNLALDAGVGRAPDRGAISSTSCSAPTSRTPSCS